MKKSHLLALILPLLLAFSLANAQVDNRKGLITNTKAILKKADKEYQREAYTAAIDLYKQVLEKESTNNDVKLKIAEAYRLLNIPEESEIWFRQIADNAAYFNSLNPVVQFHFGLVLESLGQYNYAKEWFESYRKLAPTDQRVVKKLESIYNIEKFYVDSSLYVLKHLKINTTSSELSPTIYNGGIVFISDRRPEDDNDANFNPDSVYFMEMYYSRLMDDGLFDKPVVFNNKLAPNYHKGASIFYDNGKKMIFTRNTKSGISLSQLGLYFSQKAADSEEWIRTRPFTHNSNKYSIAHPAVTSDGKTLFFTSNLEGGRGETDIWVSRQDEDGKWGEPENLGKKVNTLGSEGFPFVYQDTLLYFSSNGHGGLGGTDIFKYNLKTGEGPINVGYPINSKKNDFGFVVDQRGYTGYFSSNRDGSIGTDDIYQFNKHVFIEGKVNEKGTKDGIANVSVLLKDEKTNELKGAVTDEAGNYKIKLDLDAAYRMFGVKNGYKIGQEQVITTFGNFTPLDNIGLELQREDLLAKGKVFDSNGFPVEGAYVRLLDNSNNKSRLVTTGPEGQYTFTLKSESWYTVTVEAKGYFSDKAELDAFTKKFGSFENSFKLQAVELDKWLVINSIKYGDNKSDIKPLEEASLDNLANFLNSNPSLFIEVKVHTDTRNTEKFNLDLSKTRARTILYHLAKKGVEEHRIISSGYGSSQPLHDCETCSLQENEQNRRVEIMLRQDVSTSGSGSRRR
ncbi:carboxypeptidase regulatory-like domain-containing protein [Flammeovirgaceae bacterium SG7u.111]|nr:carboxypeptidase regulatory-like domain-containing protein [Flammeovirgaceae bacterium SG7u.132]WPO33553.1 carboxypeptidase regulatory-like domain-containing protein [Flammeovirgaceae bacterium SG7u.111]